MNQILITKKLYVTPELKRKKKMYKLEFFISIFVLCILMSVYIYAEYDRNKSEEVSQEILANVDMTEETANLKSDTLVIVLDDEEQTEEINKKENNNKAVEVKGDVQTTPEGFRYTTVAVINIPKINVRYAVLDGETDSIEETDALLKISPTKFWGPNPNEDGNFSIVGHNYRDTRFFSKVPTLENGDIIEITNLSTEQTIQYEVYTKYEVVPTDISCIDPPKEGKEVTLITCTNDNKHRVIVKAKAI